MRVLFVSSGTTDEGVNSLIRDQGESLKEQGILIEYFIIKNKGISGYLRNILKLKNHLKKNQYDIIHAHYGLSGFVALIAKQKRNKLIISFMGTDLMGNVSRNGTITILGRSLVTVSQLLVKNADYVIVKSQAMANKLVSAKVSIIPNGLDLKLFHSIDKSFALSRVGWDKQFQHILFMSDPKRPEKNYLLTETALNYLENCNIQLHFLNHISHNEVVFYYNASDVCLLSSYHEGSPNVIKEAMACNCPIVSTNVGDVKWLLGNTDGCFITSFEPEDVADKIKKALKFGQKTNGCNRIIELGLDAKNVAREILDLYKKVLKVYN